ncbi:MAG: NAD-dependent epimerase/dehydratase family protein [Proteobacteria bacterium]|nr:NAD-dependent epimerase/dehydratase family protein [Pseudomonadota bacterium]
MQEPSNGKQENTEPDQADGAVLITGICGRIGQLLARKLHRAGPVVGIDRRRFEDRPSDVAHHRLDLRRKRTRDVFRSGGIRAVVHLGTLHNVRASNRSHHSFNVAGFQKLVEHMAEYRVPKLVVLSSARLYGPRPDNPQFLTEEAPLLGAQEFSEIRDLVEVDILSQSFFWKHPETETVILRPCHILGRINNAASNYLRLPRPWTLLGFDPMVQVVHERDVADAIELALRPGLRGIFNLRGPAELPLGRVLRILDKRPVSLPASVAAPLLDRLWSHRLSHYPRPELDHLRYVCMVDDARARRVLGYRARRSLEETVRSVFSPR